MIVDGAHHRTLWLADDGWSVEIIDQTRLPHEFVTVRLRTSDEAAIAIREMQVRGAPLIGATAAYGIALKMRADASDSNWRTRFSSFSGGENGRFATPLDSLSLCCISISGCMA